MRAPVFLVSACLVATLVGCTAPGMPAPSTDTHADSAMSWSQSATHASVASAYHLTKVDVQLANGDASAQQRAVMQKLADSIGSQTAGYFTGKTPVIMRVTLDDVARRKLGGQVALLDAAGTVLHQDRIYETDRSRRGSLASAVDLGVGVGIGSGGKTRWGIGLGLDLLNVLAALGSSGPEPSAELNKRFAERVGIWLQGLHS